MLLAVLLTGYIPTAAQTQGYEVPAHHPNIEFIARDIAYRGGERTGGPKLDKDPKLLGALKHRGLELKDSIDDEKTGLQAMVLHDPAKNQDYIAFRGTLPNKREGSGDVIADADLSGDTGSSQYNKHREALAKWADKYPNSIVTGHSLGAALAQRFMSEHPEKVREGVVFNAPAIATSHGHRFARAAKQPPVTIYVGGSKVGDDVEAPGFDIVSEFGGQAHLPGKIVEVTDINSPEGLGGTLLNNHTAWMLRGKDRDNRQLSEIPYEEYEQRRQDNWTEAGPLLRSARNALETADALQGMANEVTGGRLADALPEQVQETGNAIANLAQGFARSGGGPVEPTPVMRSSAKRDCAGASAYVDRAKNKILGSISAEKLSEAHLYINLAADRSVGCPAAKTKSDDLRGVLAAASQKVLAGISGAADSCDRDVVSGALNKIASLRVLPQFAEVYARLLERRDVIAAGKPCAGEERSSETAKSDEQPPVELTPPSCQLATNEATIGRLAATARDGNAAAAAHIGKLKNVNATLASVEGGLKQSAQKIAAEDLSGAQSVLAAAKEKLVSLGNAPSCLDLLNRIAKEQSKLDSSERALSAAKDALESCSSAAIAGVITQFSGIKYPPMQSIIEDARTVQAAHAAHSQAVNTISHGKFAEARTELAATRDRLDNIRGVRCTRLREKINASLTEIETFETLIAGAKEAADGCDEKEIATWQRAIKDRSHPALVATRTFLEGAAQRCKLQDAEAMARMTRSCKKKSKQNGAIFNYVEKKDDGTYYCHWCKAGHYPKKRNCVPSKKTANKWCNDNNPGSHWYAINIKSDGTHGCKLDVDALTAEANAFCRKDARKRGKVHARVEFKKDNSYNCYNCEKGYRASGKRCIPTQKTANRWCNANNAGTGWRAYNIKSNGQFSCRQTGRAARRAALRDCRRQHGKRLLRVERQNGQYVCRYCAPGSLPRNGNCYTANANRRNPTRRVNPSSRIPCNPTMENYGKCWGNPGPQKRYKCMKRPGYGPFGC